MKFLVKTIVGLLLTLSAVGAQAACDNNAYNSQKRTLENIWNGTYNRNCVRADEFINRFAQPTFGLSSCRIDSTNQAKEDFARQIKNSCVSACEDAGLIYGKELGESLVAEFCGAVVPQIAILGPSRVACVERVAATCIEALQGITASYCPEAFDDFAYYDRESACINWAN